jgi:hypothetical protein
MTDATSSSLGFPLGGRIIAQSRFIGTVKYVGPTHFKPGDWIGVQLDSPVGKNNGTVGTTKYFECETNHGLFVRPSAIHPYSNDLAASCLIQSVSRRHLAKKRVHAELNSRTWNMLDNHIEELNVRNGKKMSDASQNLAGKGKSSLRKSTGEDDIDIEPGYNGPHISWPLDTNMVLELLEHFKLGHSLHAKYTMQMLNKYRAIANALPTLETLSIPEGTKLTVCGDTHGQLQDVFTIFTINGLPSPTNRYLFNGDFVDRGEHGKK